MDLRDGILKYSEDHDDRIKYKQQRGALAGDPAGRLCLTKMS